MWSAPPLAQGTSRLRALVRCKPSSAHALKQGRDDATAFGQIAAATGASVRIAKSVALRGGLVWFRSRSPLTNPTQRDVADFSIITLAGREPPPVAHHLPVLGIDAHGSCLGFDPSFCSSSMEMLSGERMKAMRPSRGGRLMVIPAFIS